MYKLRRRVGLGLAIGGAIIVLLAGAFFAYKKAQGLYQNLMAEVRAVRQQQTDSFAEAIYWTQRGTNEMNAMLRAQTQRGHYDFDYSWVEEASSAPLIAHAFGDVDENTYTNSLEAFEANYAQGHRIFEVDFELTDDTYLMVAAHDKGTWYKQNDVSEDLPFTEALFKTVNAAGYTPLDCRDVIDLMAQYPDIYIVTDTKYQHQPEVALEFSQLVRYAQQTAPETLERIIPQIYNMEMLDSIMDIYAFRSVIFTLYAINWYPQSISQFCQTSGVGFVTVSDERYDEELAGLLAAQGAYLAVHTINDVQQAQAYLDSGVALLYTDFLDPQDLLAADAPA